MPYEDFIPYARDVGATIIVFALLAYAHYHQKFQHEREMARDEMLMEALRDIQRALEDCLRPSPPPPPAA